MDSGFGSRGKRFRVYQFKGSVRLCGKIVSSVVRMEAPIEVIGHADVDIVVIQTLYSVYIELLQKKCRRGESNSHILTDTRP